MNENVVKTCVWNNDLGPDGEGACIPSDKDGSKASCRDNEDAESCAEDEAGCTFVDGERCLPTSKVEKKIKIRNCMCGLQDDQTKLPPCSPVTTSSPEPEPEP